jgi:hypothetical protein
MASEESSEPRSQDAQREKLTRAEHLRRAREALDRQLEHRERFFESLERLEKFGRSR